MITAHIPRIAEALGIAARQVSSTLALLEEGATVPFIARYRKEATGGLDEVQIGEVREQARKWDELEKRRESILKSIEEQGKLSEDLRQRLLAAQDIHVLEDLYLPYKRKRRTRATIAREKGLEPLAEALWAQPAKADPLALAKTYLSAEVPSLEDALQGARDIIAERVSEDEAARQLVRQHFAQGAVIRSKVARGKEEAGAKYRDYFEYEERLDRCPSHRLLALRRGEDEGILRVIIEPDGGEATYGLKQLFELQASPAGQQVALAIEDAYERLLAPSVETEFRQSAKEKADEEAIRVFADNLRQLLLAAPLGPRRIIALDPGFRTGCKVACLSEDGSLLHHSVIYPHPPQNEWARAQAQLQQLARQYAAQAIAIGNGTASRETENLARSVAFDRPLDIFVVSEAGASVYSASEVAREEFPNEDVTVRGAISIGRRLMDPLSELVKIDPKAIGVGQYQHDVNPARLKSSLDATVESCVNAVGVNLNTASKHLLAYVSGLGPALAQNIVQHRADKGPFRSRRDLLKVPRMGAKTFEQCAGFLRLPQGEHPLDATAVHPESYHIVERMAADLGCRVPDLIKDAALRKRIKLERYADKQVGLPTLKDILKELEKPGLDPRGRAEAFAFAEGVQRIEDLHEGMVLPGLVTNLTNFGAFVDIGVKQSGLLHVSQITNRFINNPSEVLKLQQPVRVKVIGLDLERGRIQLSMKDL